MKRLSAIFIICILIAVPFFIPLSQMSEGLLVVSSSIRVHSVTTDEQSNSDIFMYNKIVYAVWEDGRNGDKDIFFAKSIDDGKSFLPAVRVDDTDSNGAPGDDDSNQYDPSIAIDNTGKIYVVWADTRDDPDEHIYCANSTDGGSTWGTNHIVDDDTSEVETPEIALNSTGGLIIVWADKRNGNKDIYLTTSSDGENFASNVQVDGFAGSFDQVGPCISTRGDDVFVCWNDKRDNKENIFFRKSTDGGASFSTASINVTDATTATTQRQPSMSLDVWGNIYIAFEDRDTGNSDISVMKSIDGGATFGSRVTVNSVLTATQNDPYIYAGGPGILFCAWSDLAGGTWDVYIAESTDAGTTWANHTQVDDAPGQDQTDPVFLTEFGGKVHILWTDNRDGDRDIYYTNITHYIPPVNTPPTLVPHNATPLVGSPDIDITFSLTYTDADNDYPDTGYPKVYIYTDANGTTPYMGGVFTLTQTSSGDSNVVDGKDYSKAMSIDGTGMFSYRYQIKSTDNPELVNSTLFIGPEMDNVPVVFINSSVNGSIWFKRPDLYCNITINDPAGFGVNGSLIRYRHTKTGIGNISRWYQVSSIPHNDTISVSKQLVFAEGTDNYIQWNATDVAGNGPTFSEYFNIKVDMTEVEYKEENPASGDTVQDEEIDFLITVSDLDEDKAKAGINVSGVDISSLQWRLKSPEGVWSEWNSTGITEEYHFSNFDYRMKVHITGLEVGSNGLQLRCRDIAGNGMTNGYTESKTWNFILEGVGNRAPQPPTWIAPNSTMDLTPKISWGPGFDKDGDNLTYMVQVGTETIKDFILPWLSVGSKRYYNILDDLKVDTTYLVQIKCSDGELESEIFQTTLNITSTGNQPPSAPTNLSPRFTSDFAPKITWDESTDPDSSNIMYFIQIGTSSGGGDLLPWTRVPLGTYYDTPKSLIPDYGTYYVQLQAFDGIDYSDTATIAMKIAEFKIEFDDFNPDLTVGEVKTYDITVQNSGTSSDQVTLTLEGSLLQQTKIFIDDEPYDVNGTGVILDLEVSGTLILKLQFRVNEDAVPGTYALFLIATSEDGLESGRLDKDYVDIKARTGGDIPDPNNRTTVDDDDTDPMDLAREYWWVLAIIVGVIILLIIIIAVASSVKKSKEEKRARESFEKDKYEGIYQGREQEVEYAPDRGSKSYDDMYSSPPPSRSYSNKAAPINVQPPQTPSPASQEYNSQDASYFDNYVVEPEQPVEDYGYDQPPAQDYYSDEAPLDDDQPKDIYGYDEDEDLDLEELDEIEEEPQELEELSDPTEDDESYLDFDEL